jgi:hypothetical protein
MYDPQTQTLTPMGTPTFTPQPYYPQPFTQAYPIVQPYPYQPNPQTFQQPLTQMPAPAITQPTTSSHPSPTGDKETSISPEEMEDALQGEDGEYSDSDSELLKEDSDEESSNKTTTDANLNTGTKSATTTTATTKQ